MMNRLTLSLGASALSLVVFIVALHVHFPGDAVVERARWEVQNLTDGDLALEASGAGWWMPGGITLHDASLIKIDKSRRTSDDDDGSSGSRLFTAQSASARLALLPLLSGTQVIQYAAEVYGGELHGEFGTSSTHQLITVQTDGLDLTQIPLKTDDWSIDAKGILHIDADLAIASERGKDAPDSEGSVLIEIDDFVITNSTMMGMDLVAAEFSEAVLELKMKGKKAEIERGRFESELVDLTIDGHVNMSASALDRWRLRLELSFTLGESLDTMASMVPSLKRARGEDGTYHMLCTGTWGNPVCREDRSKVRGERPQRRGRGMDAAGPDEERPSTSSRRKKRRSDDAEKRREDRRRRLEDRRSRLREERPEELEEEGFDNGPDIELDREFDRPGPRRPPFGPGEDLDLPPQQEFEDDFVPPDFDEGGLPLDEQSDEGEYIDE
jgi:type II secretion system protein N